jgi:hypothetical protein
MAPIERKKLDLKPLKDAGVPIFFIVGRFVVTYMLMMFT